MTLPNLKNFRILSVKGNNSRTEKNFDTAQLESWNELKQFLSH